jgi:SAM-dependent methyltransferase
VGNATEVRVNIGAGQTRIPGFINVDISNKADISLDVGKDPLPFADSSVDVIFSYHTLEHIPDYLFALSEIHRVLKHGGRFLVGLPYVTLTKYHLVNPYHLHNFNEYSFYFFDVHKLKGSAAEENAIMFKRVFHRFHYVGTFNLIPPPIRTWGRLHLLNVVRAIDYGLIAVKRVDDAVPSYEKRVMKREFNECLKARMPYKQDEQVPSRPDQSLMPEK